MNLPTRRNQRGVATNQIVIALVVAIAVIVVLWLVLRDQGKDDKNNEPGVVTSQLW